MELPAGWTGSEDTTLRHPVGWLWPNEPSPHTLALSLWLFWTLLWPGSFTSVGGGEHNLHSSLSLCIIYEPGDSQRVSLGGEGRNFLA